MGIGMNKILVGNKKAMTFNLEVDEVKKALFQHLRNEMTGDEEIQYMNGKAQMSINFKSYGPSSLQFEIIIK
jgi:hypothetical protein